MVASTQALLCYAHCSCSDLVDKGLRKHIVAMTFQIIEIMVAKRIRRDVQEIRDLLVKTNVYASCVFHQYTAPKVSPR